MTCDADCIWTVFVALVITVGGFALVAAGLGPDREW